MLNLIALPVILHIIELKYMITPYLVINVHVIKGILIIRLKCVLTVIILGFSFHNIFIYSLECIAFG